MSESRTHELARALLKILANDHHGGFGDYPLSPAAFAAAKELYYQLPMLVESLPPYTTTDSPAHTSPSGRAGQQENTEQRSTECQ